MWTEVSFGKHSGKVLPLIIMQDPDYFFWAVEQNGLFKGPLRKEATSLLRKVRNIGIPKDDPEKWTIEHFTTPDGKYSNFQIVELKTPLHEGSSPTWREPKLDFKCVRNTRIYDKLGYKNFISDFKYYYFGSRKARLTKDRCEAFFDSEKNFR